MKRLAIVVLAGCGAHASPSVMTRGSGTENVPHPDLVLYRDGAMVRVDESVNALAGKTTVSMQVPPDVGAGDLVARVVTPASGVEVGEVRVIESSLQIGDHVSVIDGKHTVSGVIRMMGEGAFAIEGPDGVRLVLDAHHVVREGSGNRHVEVELESAAPVPNATVELVYVTRKLAWTADYTLVMDAAAHSADLHGALGIDNGTGVTYDGATLTLVDTPRPTRLTAFDQTLDDDSSGKPGETPVADPTKPRAEQPVKLKKPTETPRTILPFLVDVEPGSQSVSLLGRMAPLHAIQTLVYDPVGDDKNQTGATPYTERDYGLDRNSSAVSQSIDVDLGGEKSLTGMPAGRVRLLERTATGALSPLGEARIFERVGTDTQAISPTTSVAIGRAGEVEGVRKRREFTLDAETKRLTEEFEIDLTSTADHPVDVIVREHMYRGLTWALAYQSAGDRVSKEGPQKVALTTTVPAKGKARVVYRVVYHW